MQAVVAHPVAHFVTHLVAAPHRMSGSNFLDEGDLRHPLVNTGGFTAAKEILFLHADEANYKARLDGSGHAVRSSVRAFALRHSIPLYVTCKLDDTHL